jgi:hypothetical protein
MTSAEKCPCGLDPKTIKRADEFTAWFRKDSEERKIREKHLPRGDCSVYIENYEACNYSCVGI